MAAVSPEAKERERERNRRAYAADRDARLAQQREYRERTKAERNARRRARYAASPEVQREQVARYQRENRDKVNEARRKAYAQDPTTTSGRNVDGNARRRAEVIAGYGGACVCCGNGFLPHLTIDHVNGGGADERRAIGGRGVYARLWRMLAEGLIDPDYQVLCWNCNAAKHHRGACLCQEDEG